MVSNVGVRRSGGIDRQAFLGGMAALVAAAVATRLYRLATWSLAGDELATLRDSLDPSFSPVKQLLFWLNHLLVAPVMPLDELGLRLFPAIFGILAVPILVYIGARLVGRRAALVAGLLLVFNPWHLYWSQMARYYTLVFLLATVSAMALYLGVRDRDQRWLLSGLIATVVAGLAHPTGILPAVGFLVWFAIRAWRRTTGRRRTLLLGIAGSAALVGLALAVPLLRQWAGLDQDWGIGGLQVGLSYTFRLGPGFTLAAAAGVALAWFGGRREMAGFLSSVIGVPVILIAVIGYFLPVHTGYLFATAPFALLAAGVCVDRLVRVQEDRRERLLVGAALAGLVVAASVPSFVSHYLDGGRGDFRGAARHIMTRAGPVDEVLVAETGAFQLVYAPQLNARPLGSDTARLESVYRSVVTRDSNAVLWVVPHIRSSGGFGLQGFDKIEGWVRDHCEREVRLGAIRIDHQREFVEVWRCSKVTALRTDSTAGVPRRFGPRNDARAGHTARERLRAVCG